MRVCKWSLVLFLLAIPLVGRAAVDIFHDPFLNWDFVNFTGVEANNFEIIVDAPNWTPNGVYTGFFPNFSKSPVNGGLDTLLSWKGRNVPPATIAHVGLGMQGSGRILDAYWTKDGNRIPGGSLAIVYERTRVRRDPIPGTTGTADITMVLQATRGPDVTEPVMLTNIQTFMDLPAPLLGLDDLNADLDQQVGRLSNYRTSPNPDVVQNLPIDSFFDVFVGTTQNIGPEWESLLIADVVVGTQKIGMFWNLNPQCPEPTSLLGLLALGGLLRLRPRSVAQAA